MKETLDALEVRLTLLNDAREVGAPDGEDLTLVDGDDGRVALLVEERGRLADEGARLDDHRRAASQLPREPDSKIATRAIVSEAKYR